MGKTLYRKYIDSIRNIEVHLPLCVSLEFWVLMKLSFRILFRHLPSEGEGKGKDN